MYLYSQGWAPAKLWGCLRLWGMTGGGWSWRWGRSGHSSWQGAEGRQQCMWSASWGQACQWYLHPYDCILHASKYVLLFTFFLYLHLEGVDMQWFVSIIPASLISNFARPAWRCFFVAKIPHKYVVVLPYQKINKHHPHQMSLSPDRKSTRLNSSHRR